MLPKTFNIFLGNLLLLEYHVGINLKHSQGAGGVIQLANLHQLPTVMYTVYIALYIREKHFCEMKKKCRE